MFLLLFRRTITRLSTALLRRLFTVAIGSRLPRIDRRIERSVVGVVSSPLGRRRPHEPFAHQHRKQESRVVHRLPRTQLLHVVQAAAFEKATREWKFLDKTFEIDFEQMTKLGDGAVALLARDHADRVWIAEFMSDHGPLQYYAFDRASKKGTFIAVHRPKLKGLVLAPMKGVSITARDGLKLAGYLTLPQGVEAKNLPLVLFPHGGPWARDTWSYNRDVQLLANRGYAVLQVNFRGSTGYGKKFLHAGDRQWGRKMHDDLIDAVQWAVTTGIADPKRVAIYGGSYGGYSALAGATFSPDVFRCSVDIFGISNVTTFMKSIPPYWTAFRSIIRQRVGDHEDPKDVEFLNASSPLYAADKIKIPLLIAQGTNDVRVVPAESEQILSAIEKNKGRATYVVYSDEGHGFLRPENNLDFTARAESFLAGCLSGRAEPMSVPGRSLGNRKGRGSSLRLRYRGRLQAGYKMVQTRSPRRLAVRLGRSPTAGHPGGAQWTMCATCGKVHGGALLACIGHCGRVDLRMRGDGRQYPVRHGFVHGSRQRQARGP